MRYRQRFWQCLKIRGVSFKRHRRVFFINILILISLILLSEMLSWLILRKVPPEKLLSGLRLQKAIWEAAYQERNVPLPKGPRVGYGASLLYPKKIAPNVIWMDPPIKIPNQLEVTDNGFQIIGDPRSAKFKILIIGASTAFSMYSSNIKNTYFSQVNDYLISEGMPCIIYVLAHGGWQSDQEIIGLIYYGLEINPDIVIFLDGLNDLVFGRQFMLETLKSGFEKKSLRSSIFKYFKKYFEDIDDYIGRLDRYSNTIKLIKLLKRHQLELAIKTTPADKNNEIIKHKTTLDAEVKKYLFNMGLAKTLAQDYRFKVIYIPQPFIGFKNKLSALEEEVLIAHFPTTKVYNLKPYKEAYEKMKAGLAALSDGESAYFFDCSNALANEEKTTFFDLFHFSDIGDKLLADCYKENLLSAIRKIQSK